MRLAHRISCFCILSLISVYFLISLLEWLIGDDLDGDSVVHDWLHDPQDPFCVWFNYTKAKRVPNEDSISLCTHASVGYSKFVFNHVEQWSDHVSVSLLLDGDGFQALATYRKLLRCTPEARARVSTHLVWRANNCSSDYVSEGLARVSSDPLPDNCDLHTHLPFFHHRLRAPYPPNTLRNVARTGAGSPLHLVADIENHLSAGAAEVIRAVGETVRNRSSALVVRRFEVEKGEVLPRTVGDLYRLLAIRKAVPFHHYFWRNGHIVPGLDVWLNYSLRDASPPLLTPVNYRGSKWEPQLVVHRDHLCHYEGFPIRFRDQQSLSYELCRAGVQFHVISHVFSFHQGIKHDATPAEIEAKKIASDRARVRHAQYRTFLTKTYPPSAKCGRWSEPRFF